MKQGEFQFLVRNRVSAVKWMDAKEAYFLSYAHSPRNTTTVLRSLRNGSRIAVGCPEVVAVYNQSMRGVDLFDRTILDRKNIHKVVVQNFLLSC